ncbi:hypothetical protein CBR_g55204 [Chara braunii]|uniref:Protein DETOXIFICATION n=1 Tax=Chara braunii TaxID=69332 RepID=A0A388MCN4_CHABU|nr:hypothetical protein CBR_g55204 [Chara braunii]|eukprot:GBG92324.1 hypothetical protein CBR_g55204 [Chara braunii]
MDALSKNEVPEDGGMASVTDAPVKGTTRTNYDVQPMASNLDVNGKESKLENWELREPPELPRYLPKVWERHIQFVGSRLPRLSDSSQIGEELKKVFALAAPTSLANILWYSRVIVSTVYLGHLGKIDLAGGALAMGFGNVTGYSIVIGLSTGLDPICAQAYGARNYKLLQLTLQRAIIIFQCVVALVVITIWLSMERILILVGQDPGIAAVAGNYVLVLIADLVVYGFMLPMRTYLRSHCITIPLSFCAGIALLIHIPLNYLFIVKAGHGYRGAALASVCTDFSFPCMLVITIWLITPKEGAGKWHGWSWECMTEWGPILRPALPSCISLCAEVWTYEVFSLLAGLLPDPGTTVATMSILLNCSYMFNMTPMGVSVSASTRVGIELGANSPSAAHLAAYVAWSIGFIFSVISILFFSLLGRQVGWLFTDIASVQLLIGKVPPLLGVVQAFSAPLNVGAGILRGCARPGILLRVTFMAFYLIALPIAVCLVFLLRIGVPGLWWGLIVGEACAFTAIATCIILRDWETEAKRAQMLVKHSRGHNVMPYDDERPVDAVETGQICSINKYHPRRTAIDHDNNSNHSLTVPLLNDSDEDLICHSAERVQRST